MTDDAGQVARGSTDRAVAPPTSGAPPASSRGTRQPPSIRCVQASSRPPMFLRGSSVPTQMTGPSAGTCVRGGPVGRAVVAGDHARRIDAEPLRDLPRDGGRDGDDQVGSPGVRADQRRVVALDLGGGGLRMIEEEQVVDGDHLRGARGRQQQGRGGVRDVDARRPATRWAAIRVDATPSSAPAPGPGRRGSRLLGPGERRRSFQLLEKTATRPPTGAVAASAIAVRCTYSPTPVRARRAGR